MFGCVKFVILFVLKQIEPHTLLYVNTYPYKGTLAAPNNQITWD